MPYRLRLPAGYAGGSAFRSTRGEGVRPLSPSSLVATLRAAGCVFAEEEAQLLLDEASTPDQLAAMVSRRVAGEPLEHVLGWVAFCGRRIWLDPAVFIPRRRTEFLARRAVALAPRPDGRRDRLVVDLCCGSGAVGAVVAAELAPVQLIAADLDPIAVRCARRNLPDGARVYQGDLFEPLPADLRGRVHLLVANAPYVPSDAVELMPWEAREHEPRTALDGGFDGLDVLRRVLAGAPSWLAPGGHVLVESSRTQAPVLVGVAASHGLVANVVTDDEASATVVTATLPAG
ncbi:MAG TPA: putative protein N(5)-glutamine methyltransferase [Micromonosporaceae bacterium]